MLDVTLDELIAVLGNPTRTSGHQYYFRCPACSEVGGDTSGDNLLYNDKKGVLKCFACDDGAKKALQLVNANRAHQTIHFPTEQTFTREEYTPWWQKNLDNLCQYMVEANEEMTDEVAEWLWMKHGINKQTIQDCLIGYDSKPSLLSIGPSVTFPFVSLNHEYTLVGFELRQVGSQKVIKHTLDAPNCLCVVSNNAHASYLIICEGFKDAYCFKQLLEIKQIGEQFDVLTPSHGVNSILNNIPVINLTKYEKYYLLLDNDNAGDETTAKILEKYPFFIDKRNILNGCKDVAEYWMRNYVETVSEGQFK